MNGSKNRGLHRGFFLASAASFVGAVLVASVAGAEDRQTYAVFDAVFLGRDNVSANQPLVINATTLVPNISAQDMQFATQPGIRLFYGMARVDDVSWELGYLGVWNMFADANVTDSGNLAVAGDLGLFLPSDQSVARATYSSSLNTAEANIFIHRYDGGPNRTSGKPWQRCDGYSGGSVDWLAGFRWAGLDESATLALSDPGSTNYSVRSTTNLFGAQAGARGRMEWDRWAFEGWAKAALAGSALSQSQNAIVDPLTGDILRTAASSNETGVGLIGDINASLIYRLSETWGLRVGYNLIWLSGVALAPNQFNMGTTPSSGTSGEFLGSTTLNGGSSVFLQGANLGLEARW